MTCKNNINKYINYTNVRKFLHYSPKNNLKMYDQKLGRVISTQLVMKMPQSKSISENMEMITQHI